MAAAGRVNGNVLCRLSFYSFFLSRKYFSIALRQKIAHNYSWNFRQMRLNLLFSGLIIAAESLRSEVMPHPPIRLTGGM
jgi:hypothetical protein